MNWLEVRVTTDGEAAEAVAEALRPLAHGQGVVLEQLGDESSAEPEALEPTVNVKIYLPAEQDTPSLRRRIEEILYHLNRLYPVPPPLFQILAEEDWANAWKAQYHPFRVGRHLLVQPSWQEAAPVAEEDIVLTLDPGMAFGTGLHPTTQMCLEALETLVRRGHRVLDVGTGSGILAVAAARLGAARVLGLDTDERAVAAARENAGINGVGQQVEIRQGSLAGLAEQPWNLIVVNILAPVIIDLLLQKQLLGYLAPRGHLVLSGIIAGQMPAVVEAVSRCGALVSATAFVRDWVTLTVRLPPPLPG